MRYIFIYGLISGLVIMAVLLAGLSLVPEGDGIVHTIWFGYLVMLVALTFVFVAVKRYRDIECGGVIKFVRALLIGLATSGVAALAYVAIWEVYLAATDYAFMGEYMEAALRQSQAAGVTGAALAAQRAEMEAFAAQYNSNPLLRFMFTFIEIAPAGLLVSFVSAALLRNPKFLPARVRDAETKVLT